MMKIYRLNQTELNSTQHFHRFDSSELTNIYKKVFLAMMVKFSLFLFFAVGFVGQVALGLNAASSEMLVSINIKEVSRCAVLSHFRVVHCTCPNNIVTKVCVLCSIVSTNNPVFGTAVSTSFIFSRTRIVVFPDQFST